MLQTGKWSGAGAADVRFGRFELRPAVRQLLIDGEPASLGARAFDVLLALVERRERLVGKDELLDLAWPGLVVEENNLQVQISTLRKVLGEGVIVTVPGHGYRFAADVSSSAGDERAKRRDNLPHALTRFIGHETNLEDYEHSVGSHRLVTLTGAGGCGKTRLALRLASRVLPTFADGAWFVELAPIADAERLPRAVTQTLGLAERPGQPVIETLCEHVAERQMLLVVDNCEHLLSAAASLVAAMLLRAPRLTVLATSREPLGVLGEQTMRVRSLSCPTADDLGHLDGLARFEAVELFVDRARLVQPSFTLDAEAAPAVAEICRRLDGIPLAIELAAARMRVCSVNELRKMLDDRFRVLAGGSSMAPPRQRTLQATMEWSFDLLTADERNLLERLSVFAGGWTLEGAAAVAADARLEVLGVLTRLVDKSLVAAHPHGQSTTRYTMLETTRQYALDSLGRRGDAVSAKLCHLEHFVELAERLEPAFEVRKQGDAIEQLAPELDNIVQALRGCEGLPGGPELGLRLAATLHEYWVSLGLIDLGHRLTTETLRRRAVSSPSASRARALFGATRCARFLRRVEEARGSATECIAIARGLHDDHMEVAALAYLGIMDIDGGDTDQGIATCEEALRLAQDRGYVDQVARALNMIGWAYRGRGEFERARTCFEEALAACRTLGDGNSIAMVACNLAEVRMLGGDGSGAATLLLEAMDLSRSAGSKWTTFNVLHNVVPLAAMVGDWRAAARMLGALAAVGSSLGMNLDAGLVPGIAVATINALGKADYDSEHEAGQASTLEQAVDETRAWLGGALKP